jgi:DNA-binding MarR family transcriptional regulator
MPGRNFDAAITDFVQAVGLLVRRVRAAGSHELSWTQSAVLGRLIKGGPATTADLARAESMKPQSMGATVAALEDAGMVVRAPHPTDGRQMIIKPTPKGEAERKRSGDAWLAQAIAELGAREQQTLFAAGDIIRRLADTR